MIVNDLHISESTVAFHVGNIPKKLNVASRVEAAIVGMMLPELF